MARSIYDSFGFDRYGYNKDGYDRMGYNREGYDREGFDRNGLNRQGINKLTGFDKDGFGPDGFNKDGYDREGYNHEGFDVTGYDREGYDCEGYNALGIDKEGFNRQGYNREGYDRKGFNRAGYDKEGFDRNGYDRGGYDREGFNAAGRNRDGYDREGYDLYGFTSEGMNKNGFNIWGISEEGVNVLGYFPDGFDADGKSVYGFSRDLFDEDGYHIYTGFNLKGFDRQGFNINGLDSEGYDKEGFHSITGYNRNGFDREGFGHSGYNKDGYDRLGYNRDGYDKEGYDVDGYNKQGYNRQGYDRDGYDKNGYDINGYDASGMLEPSRRQKQSTAEMNPEEDRYEAAFFKKCEAQIKGYYQEQVKKEVMREYTPSERTYIDRWGFVQTDVVEPDLIQAKWEINSRVNAVLREPYFCHVDYSGNPELYLGKRAVHGWITDWADERASLYYQYQMYIGDKETGLNLVRDIIFSKSNKYKGYKDLYNKNQGKENIAKVADSHLSQIIEANQENKKIHDIIESIQQNQYRIITSDKDKSSLVLGCAGSGKTMILMHKIRYMKYNHQDLKMDDIMVISPTDILGRESQELSKILQVERIQQFTTASFYETCCKDMLIKLGVPFEEFHVIDDGEIRKECYQKKRITDLKVSVYENLVKGEQGRMFIRRQQQVIKKLLDHHTNIFGLKRVSITEMHNLYLDSVNEIKRVGKRDIERLISRIDEEVQNQELLENVKDLIQFLRNNRIFKIPANSLTSDKDNIEKRFFYTKKAADAMDFDEFMRVRNHKELIVKSQVEGVQILQLFIKEKLDLEGVRKILKEWETISEQDVKNYLTFIERELEKIDRIDRKRDVLQYLLDNDIVSNRKVENNTLKYDTSFEKLLKLFDETEKLLVSIGYTPFRYFEEYDKIIRKQRRLSDQTKYPKRQSYLFDTILEELNVEYRTDSPITVSLSKAFDMAYLLYGYTGLIDSKKRYIFVDEFQDFSAIELEFFKDLYPNAVINLFGDIRQCINEKGIRDISEIPLRLYNEKPEFINENYRNARQITEYVNQILGMDMLPVGLNGVQCIVEDIPEISIAEDDRVAIIVENSEIFTNEYRERLELNFYVESRQIVRGICNVIPVALAKGLEFEKVIVFKEGMSDNQFYVACTRAITELYVILEKAEKKIQKDVERQDSGNDALLKEGAESKDIKQDYDKDTEDIHNYELNIYPGNLKRKINIVKCRDKYISLMEGGKEKKIPVNYIKEKRQVYILKDVYIHHKEAIDKYFSVSQSVEDECQRTNMTENEKKPLVTGGQKEGSANEEIIEQNHKLDIAEIRESRIIVYKGSLNRQVDISKVQKIGIPIVVDGVEKKILIFYVKRTGCVYIPNITYMNYKKEIDKFFMKGRRR